MNEPFIDEFYQFCSKNFLEKEALKLSQTKRLFGSKILFQLKLHI
jgi:hypothetical protein